MADQTHRFGDPPPLPAGRTEGPKKSWWPTCLIGCFVMFVLVLIAGGVGVWFLAKKGPAIAAEFARTAVTSAVNESDLPAEEKKEVVAQIDRLVDGFKSGEITAEELGTAMQNVMKSNVMAGFIVAGFKSQYVDNGSWSDEEKASASRSLERLWRGMDEGNVTMDDLEPLLNIVATKNGDTWQMKQSLTDDEARQFVTKSAEIADQAAVPDEAYPIKISTTLKKFVDQIFQEVSPEAASVEIPGDTPAAEVDSEAAVESDDAASVGDQDSASASGSESEADEVSE